MLDGKGEDLGPLMRAALEYGQGAEVLEVLGGAAEDSVRAIEELCREHYGQFVTAVDDLIEVQGIAKQLKDQVRAPSPSRRAAPGAPSLPPRPGFRPCRPASKRATLPAGPGGAFPCC